MECFLKICLAIEDEIVSLVYHRSNQEHSHNTLIKDAMRIKDVSLLFDRWIEIFKLIIGDEKQSENVSMLLKIFACYSSKITALSFY